MEPQSSDVYCYYWSELEFNNAVVQLVSALQQQPEQDDCDNNERNESIPQSSINPWYWEQREEKIMLIHPPIRTTYSKRGRKNITSAIESTIPLSTEITESNYTGNNSIMSEFETKDNNINVFDNNENDEYLFIDSSIWLDESIDTSGDSTGRMTAQTHSSHTDTKENDTINIVELVWYINCIYHDTWQVPLLYFTVQNAHDGSPCTRDVVLDATGFGSYHNYPTNGNYGLDHINEEDKNEEGIDNTWTIISLEEHPITGVPSYFLHPCRTAERLGTIFHSTNVPSPTRTTHNADTSYSLNSTDNSETNNLVDNENLSSRIYSLPGIRLYSWLCMIVSSLHIIQISSISFLSVQKQIMENEDTNLTKKLQHN